MLLSELTTMRVGGPARELVTATTRDEIVEAARRVWSAGDEWLVLGGGSNVVVSDEGFDGTVIHVASRGIDRATDGVPRLLVQAGEPWDAVVHYAVEHGLAGIEALSGIPGSAGAAPMQNIGAYGQDVGGSLVAIEFLDYLTGEIEHVPASELELGYRTSALKRGRQGVVLAIELELTPSTHGAVGYAQLAAALGLPMGGSAPLRDIRARVLELRASKGMVLDPGDPDSVSCGSFFTNPIVPENVARRLPVDAPRWPVEPEPSPVAVPLGAEPIAPRPESDLVKLSAAWLIERSGIARGFRLPGSRAAISSKHTLAITNRGDATAEEVAQLARYIRTRVAAQFGIELQPEPVAVGVEL